MVHTLELSRMISEETFEKLLTTLKDIRYNGIAWYTQSYADKGISIVCLRKFKPLRRNEKGEKVILANEPFQYMIIMSINIGIMFGGDSYHSTNVLAFTPDFAKAIYDKIFVQIPELEVNADYRDKGNEILWNTGKTPLLLERYYDLNAFKLRRIDFAFDIATTPEQYMRLLELGKGIRRKSYDRLYFSDTDIVDETEDIEDDEPDFEDMEELFTEYTSSTKYLYYKSKSLNINIYLKGEQLKKKQLISEDDNSYNYLRCEMQVKKNKLNNINKKHGIHSRAFHKMPIPEIEAEILSYYINQLTGSGTYVTFHRAETTIKSYKCRPEKRKRLLKLIHLIAQDGGIKAVLDKVESGAITELGAMSTVRTYLRELQEMGINPVTISRSMEKGTPKSTLINTTGGNNLSEVVIPNLIDLLTVYTQQIEDEKQQGRTPTQEELNEIDNI